MERILYDLTNPQKSIWNTEQFFKNTSVNNIGGTIIIKDKINFSLLKKSIYEYVKTNDSFLIKLCFDEKGDIKQYIGDFLPFDIDYISFSSLEDLYKFEKKDCERIFNMLDSNLFHFTVFSLPDGTGGVVLTVHHIISDAQTVNQIAPKLMNFYSSFLNNTKPEFIQTSYIDYINSEQKYLQSEKYNNDKVFWENLFENSFTSASLTTKSVDSSMIFSSSRECFTISNEEMNKINNYCRLNNISNYHFFMSVYSLYIGKVTNEKNFVIGTPILNRTNFKEKNTAGMFISTVPFLVNLEENMLFSKFASKIGLETLSILRHQKYPYQSILEYIRRQDSSLPNLYNIMISYQINKSNGSINDIPYTTRWTHSNTNMDELDIHLFDINDTGELSIAYDYQLAKYTQEDIVLFHKRILSIIDQIIDNENLLTNNIELVLPDEKDFILNNYNKLIDIPIDKTVIDLFNEQALKSPDRLALSCYNENLTYSQLNNAVNHLAYYLESNNIKKGDNVCLFFANSIELVVSILAVLKLGACYIPIDVSYPIERIEYIIKNSDCKKILTNSKYIDKLTDLNNICLEVNLSFIKDSSNTPCENKHTPDLNDLAYIIYTSGSTGNPKGVKISHESLSNYISWANREYVHGETTNFPLYSSISFDLTVTSVFTPLISGNAIYIYENTNPQLLLKEIIDDKKVQIIKLTPAHLTLLQDLASPESIVSKLIVGGDILTNELCENISIAFSHPVHIYNEYGPTEATVGCMIYEYTKNEYSTVPIGIPAANTNLFVLNDDFNLIPFGYTGQLYIAGKGLSKGYVKLPSVTSSKFINCPFLKNALMYNSGDLVKLYNTGLMECIGRSDFQIKINGFRIEIGEIQSKILNYPGIKDCYVAALDMKNSKVLCAYYVPSENINEKGLKNYLQKALPIYMIPKYYVVLNEIPLTGNGKINKKLLPIPTLDEPNEIVAPQNSVEQVLYDIFCELLQLNELSVTSNIFNYYVDSLVIIKAQTKLYSLGYNINTQDFYDYPTIRQLSAHILSNSDSTSTTVEDDIPDIANLLKPISTNTSFNNILLFGVTGFLGSHILHELLKKTTSTIYCIIREKDNLNAIDRFYQKFSFYFPSENIKDYGNRVHLITGNILKDNFNLSSEQYNFLGSTIDCVINSAALVKHYGKYAEFYNTNIEGTRKITNFCIENTIPLHYISTISVSGYGLVSSPNTIFTEKDFYIGQNYEDNVYVKSKFEAEKLILNACKNNDLCATIYRIGNITNRFSDGVFQQNAKENAFLNRISAVINLHCIPEQLLRFPIEFTPVDYCANFIVSLLTNDIRQNNLTIYHLFNQNYLDFNYLIEFLKKNNINVKTCSIEDFENLVLNGTDNYFGIIGYLSNIKNNNLNLVTLDNNYTNSVLKRINLSWPKITEEYLKAVIDYLIKNKFIGGYK